MKKINNTPTEHEEQSLFVQWFSLQFPAIRLFSVPNGIRTGFKQAMKAKKEGMSKGVPDIFIPELNVAIEFKRIKGSSVSPEQKDWLRYLEDRCDMTCFVAYGCDEAVRFIMDLTRNKNN
jgi:hypothetical protein